MSNVTLRTKADGTPSSTADFSQIDFSGGINFLADVNRLAANEYRLGFNLRNRYSTLSGTLASATDSTAPSGKKHGLYAFGSYLVLFAGGLAYVRLSGAWTAITGWTQMSKTANRYFAETIPAAELTFARKLAEGTDAGGGILLDPATLVNSAPSALIVQDGVGQPQIIYYDAATGTLAARLTQKYSEWTQTSREYVPIGKQMVFFNGILFVVSKDGTKLYRSVSGRPIDFVVNVTTTGAKGGDAETVAYPLGFSPVTAIFEQNAEFIVYSTENDESYSLTLDFVNTIFGEPTFSRVFVFDSGAVNQFCGIDILGDFAFASREGLRSYNAVFQQRNEGRNSVFSAVLADLIRGQVQTENTCAVTWDNYAFFSLKTIYGYLVFVFDTLTQKFISLDTVTATTVQLKQLVTVTSTSAQPQLWGIGSDDSVWRLYYGGSSGISYAQSSVVLRAASAIYPGNAIKAMQVRTAFKLTPGTASGTARLYAFVDSRQDTKVLATQVLTPPAATTVTLTDVPIPLDNANTNFDWSVAVPSSVQGNNVQFVYAFPGNAILSAITAEFQVINPNGTPLISRG